MKKRILAFLLCFALVMPILPVSATETDPTETTAASSEPTVTSAPTDPSEPAPSTEPSEPTTPPVTPASDEEEEEATDPTEKETEPSNPATEPSSEPTDPSEPETEPSTEATDPSEPETEPSTEATEASEPVVDYAALYADIMACTHLFEADALLDALTEEQVADFAASLSTEQLDALNAHFDSLIAAYEAEVPEESTPVEEETGEDTREIVYPTKDMTNAAPFGEPVEGPVMRMMRMFSASPVAEEEDNGLILDKSVSEPDENGVYTITLEAYATGAKTTVKQESNIPTDIVLVLDQSGSMDEEFTSTAYRTTSGTPAELYADRNNLYVKLSNGSYSPVTVTRTSVQGETTYTSYSGQTNNTYYSNRNSLYHKCADGTYSRVNVSYSTTLAGRIYTYTCNGCEWTDTSTGRYTEPDFDSSLYRATTTTVYQYTFSYEKEDGTTETATVMASDSAPSWNFYESYASNQNTTRLAALKSAVTTFANSVATKAKGEDGTLGTEDDVDHTISIVGFASGRSYRGTNYNYGNTELFVGSRTYTYNAGSNNNATDANAAQQHYEDAPQDMSTQTGVANVTASINALDGNGGTLIDLGMEMANGILEANPVPSGEKRNRVVIVFTDGTPGWNGYDSTVASDAIEQADITKDTHKATVYTVGIFNGADATSAGNSSGNDTQKANWFMQNLSSNEGVVQTPSYYLSASDSAALNTIFKTISENIESGGSSIELDETTVVKDIIADSFQLPDGADTSSIKVYTDGVNTSTGDFNDSPTEYAANVSISGKDLSVTNFDFSENWVGSETAANGTVTYRGQKLIIEIPIVPNPDFLGGNNVPTNGSASGVYSNGELIEAFPEPDVDVDIKVLEIGVATTDQNIYLTNDADLAALVTSLDSRINGANNAYVDIVYQIKDGDTVIGTITIPAGENIPATITWTQTDGQDMTPALDETKTYTIVATASPISEGAATASTNTKTEPVNVFKPVITWQDSQINAGETPDYAKDNLVSVVWKHGDTLSTDVTMRGTEPALDYTYSPVAGPMNEDTPVDVTVKVGKQDITASVIFEHQDCDFEGCKWEEAKAAGKEFIVHIKSFDLIIVKDVVDGDVIDQSFLFNVTCPDGSKMQIVINGEGQVKIADLPTGTYTIAEDTSWSWRYDIVGSASQTVTPNNISNGTATVTFKNDRTDDQWLDGSSYAKNSFSKLSAN